MEANDLWHSTDPADWDRALERYWAFVQPANLGLERTLDRLDLDRLRGLDARGWYEFLRDEYFRWKYTARNRYASTTARLRSYLDDGRLDELDQARRRLLSLDPSDTRWALVIASDIRGLGTAGASGLLSLMYPQAFATVDQFVAKGLRGIEGLPEAGALARMTPENLSLDDGVVLIGILRGKADENNRAFGTSAWTPRKLDQVLWTHGR